MQPFDGISSPASATPTRRCALWRMLGTTLVLLGVPALTEAQRPPAPQRRPPALRPPPAKKLVRPESTQRTDKEMEAAWHALGDANPARAQEATELLYSAKGVVSFLNDHLRAASMTFVAKEVDRILAQLDAESFDVREKASAELAKMGPGVLPMLLEMMSKTDSLEVKRRLQTVALVVGEGETMLRGRRALQILLLLPDKKARAIVADISKQTPPTWLSLEAKNALQTSAAELRNREKRFKSWESMIRKKLERFEREGEEIEHLERAIEEMRDRIAKLKAARKE